jgi:hypothetical protein
MKIDITRTVNAAVLCEELGDAGLPGAVTPDGYFPRNELSPEEEARARALIDAHDASERPAQKRREALRRAPFNALELLAAQDFVRRKGANAPAWAQTMAASFSDWVDSHLTVD